MQMQLVSEVGATCLCLHIRRAARSVARIYDDALRPLDLTNGQFSLLAMLAADVDWTMVTLAAAVGSDRTSLTAAMKPLRRRGLVSSRAGEHDQRRRMLSLTAKGRALLVAAMPAWREAQKYAARLLPGVNLDRFRTTLESIV